MSSREAVETARLVSSQRWAALASLDGEGPLASMVAYATEPGLAALLLYLSGLARHSRNLLAEPRASLVVGLPDTGAGDPQTLARVSLVGRATVIERDAAEFRPAWERYVARFPDAAPRLSLGDFKLFRFVVDEARYVGGFARAARLTADELRRAGEAVER